VAVSAAMNWHPITRKTLACRVVLSVNRVVDESVGGPCEADMVGWGTVICSTMEMCDFRCQHEAAALLV
jgi:hypothetical protein